ncbi:hypothetical protein BEN44_08120 [Leptospira interrogans serovar Ricardi]|nr:hypothetical protein [Leptospira interrogans serovar Ricardi]
MNLIKFLDTVVGLNVLSEISKNSIFLIEHNLLLGCTKINDQVSEDVEVFIN